jgi:hypothetical protein
MSIPPTPPTPPQPPHIPSYQTPQPSDPVQAFIPYRNAPALISYYLGIFSILPCAGAIMGPIAIFLGLKGLKLAAQHPEARGKAHAITGIVSGSIFGLLWIILDLFALVALLLSATRH